MYENELERKGGHLETISSLRYPSGRPFLEQSGPMAVHWLHRHHFGNDTWRSPTTCSSATALWCSTGARTFLYSLLQRSTSRWLSLFFFFSLIPIDSRDEFSFQEIKSLCVQFCNVVTWMNLTGYVTLLRDSRTTTRLQERNRILVLGSNI